VCAVRPFPGSSSLGTPALPSVSSSVRPFLVAFASLALHNHARLCLFLLTRPPFSPFLSYIVPVAVRSLIWQLAREGGLFTATFSLSFSPRLSPVFPPRVSFTSWSLVVPTFGVRQECAVGFRIIVGSDLPINRFQLSLLQHGLCDALRVRQRHACTCTFILS
jgi:hypothetical protein